MKIPQSQRMGPVAGSGAKVGQQTPPPPPTPKRRKKPKQPAQPQPPQPVGTPTLDKEAKNVTVDPATALALQPRNRFKQAVNTTKAADNHDQARVPGTDISATVDVTKIATPKGGNAIDAVAKAQGWDKAPAVTNDKDLFDKLTVRSGKLLVRSVQADAGTGLNGTGVASKTMTSGTTPLGGSGMKAYGEGMYMCCCSLNSTRGSTANRVSSAQMHSYGYGKTQMMATLHPKARIASASKARQLRREFNNLPSNVKAKFGWSPNAYIAAKGYDGVQWHGSSDPSAYTTIFNKSALIFYGGVSQY